MERFTATYWGPKQTVSTGRRKLHLGRPRNIGRAEQRTAIRRYGAYLVLLDRLGNAVHVGDDVPAEHRPEAAPVEEVVEDQVDGNEGGDGDEDFDATAALEALGLSVDEDVIAEIAMSYDAGEVTRESLVEYNGIGDATATKILEALRLEG